MSATLQDFVREYYGTLLSKSEDLKTNACCASGAPPAWVAESLRHIHEDVASRFYGCGFPFPHAVKHASVLDLGCGTGRDVYVLSQLVGGSLRSHVAHNHGMQSALVTPHRT
jgi:arsenite methyltransferase